jgi:hypothetical protein
VGEASKFESGINLGYRAVRWDAAATEATELGHLGTDTSGTTEVRAYDVNNTGTVVGIGNKYVSGSHVGIRAVRWNGADTEATELDSLGTDPSGFTEARAYVVNEAGAAVGYSRKYISGNNIGKRAVVWLPDASVIDLNDLGVVSNPPDGTWQLNEARAMSVDGWVAGTGMFTPTSGPPPYVRHWVTQVGLGGYWTDAVTGSLDGTWGRGPQWSTGTPAMQVGEATFSANAAYTVDLDRNESTRSIAFLAGTVTLNTNGNTLASQSGLSIANGATVEFVNGGAATFIGDIANGGILSFGNSANMLTIQGNYTQTATGSLQIDVSSGASFDQLQISGTITLGGTLQVSFLDGYIPAAGTMFDILNWSGVRTGRFDTLVLPGNVNWNTGQLYTTGVLSVISSFLPGDFNGDNIVDAADYVVWRKGLGTAYSFDDLQIWRAHFGATAGSGSSSIGRVPEPASPLLLAAAACLLCWRWRD